MPLYQINSELAYRALLADKADQLAQLKKQETKLITKLKLNNRLYIDGFSWPAQSKSTFLLDNLYQHNCQANFRERLVCKKTRFNNRIRGAIHIFEQFCEPKKENAIYLTEQLSPLYKWLAKKYPNTIGSEFICDSAWHNRIRFKIKLWPRQLNHQDLTALDYAKDRFNYVLSFDCLEHIPDYKQAFREIYRVLKPKGQLLFSVPFDPASDETLVRASINDNSETVFHVEPEYHGNPMSNKGSLSYYTFGWDLLNTLESLGFSQAYALVYWSKKYAYLGGPQLLLCAEK